MENGLDGLMKQAKEMQEKMERLRSEAEKRGRWENRELDWYVCVCQGRTMSDQLKLTNLALGRKASSRRNDRRCRQRRD